MLHTVQVGAVTITYIPELTLPTSVRWLLDGVERAEVEACAGWMKPYYQDEDGFLVQSMHSLLVRTPDRVILVDTGVGNGKERGGAIPAFNHLDTDFLERLREAGVEPEGVDTVLCTHMHTDHVGWDAHFKDGRWVPTFPNARHLFVDIEWEHWHRVATEAEATAQLLADSITPVFEAGLVDLVRADHVVCDEVRLVPSHGHSPGHVTVEVHSQGQTAALIGDVMHSPVQTAFPGVKPALDRELEPAASARRAVLERYADTSTLVMGAHWPWPPAQIARNGEAYRAVPTV
jgi:glyoxylase-like metal-dependent hydrolase (beta-lactamase superfamily II)